MPTQRFQQQKQSRTMPFARTSFSPLRCKRLKERSWAAAFSTPAKRCWFRARYAAWRTKGLIDPCPLCMRENLSTTRTHPTGAGIRAMRILPANPRIITVLHGPGPSLPFAKRGTAYTERHPVKRHWPGSAVCGIYWKADASGRFLKFWTVISPTRNGDARPRRGGLVKFSGCGSC